MGRNPLAVFTKSVLYLAFLLLVFELTLRIQQKLGPLTDLEFKDVGLGDISWTLNHMNIPGRLVADVDSVDFAGRKITYVYDEMGLRMNSLRPHQAHGPNTFKVLFMGDSFMHGFEEEHEIPQHIWEFMKESPYAGRPMVFWNAAVSSYSPAIFVPQAKQLVPKLRPDFVVIDIDETDLGQDFIWYEPLTVRDESGSITAVRPTPRRYKYQEGYLEIRRHRFYLTRLLRKIYHRHVYLPRLIEEHQRAYGRDPLDISRDKSPEARRKYAAEIAVFEKNVDDLAVTLTQLLGDKGRILLVYHPHLQHLMPDAEGFTWNLFVSETIERVAGRRGIAFYDATEDLRKAAGGNPGKFYLTGDMHLNYEGLKQYSELIALRLLDLWKAYLNK